MPKSLVLASASPRRTALLSQIGIAHTVAPVDIDESVRGNETPLEQVNRLAAEKAITAFSKLDENVQATTVVLASDTLISLDGVSLGKPTDAADSARMLRAMADRGHEVLTSISVLDKDRQQTQCVCTRVYFGPLTDKEIAAYWRTGEPADKAGSYAIQGIGGQFVKSIDGSASAVIGLPLYETRMLLKEFGVES